MRENKLRTKVVKMLESIGAFAVENRAHDGAPDIATTLGWIELKKARAPTLGGYVTNSIVQIDLRSSQRAWHRRWAIFGGRSFILTVVTMPGGELPKWFLHRGVWAHDTLGRCNISAMELMSIGDSPWSGGPTRSQLLAALRIPAS